MQTSLDVDTDYAIEPDDVVRAVFYGLGADGTVGANKNSVKIIAEDPGAMRRAISSTIPTNPGARLSRICASGRTRSARPI
jgi:hypothetical protein